jgi:hypothetical protein
VKGRSHGNRINQPRQAADRGQHPGQIWQGGITPEGQFRYPVGLAGLEMLGYDPEILKTLSDPVAASYCGVGNPFNLEPIRDGELYPPFKGKIGEIYKDSNPDLSASLSLLA